jgi:hypothetical protein
VRLENVGTAAETVLIESLFKPDTVAKVEEVTIGMKHPVVNMFIYFFYFYRSM